MNYAAFALSLFLSYLFNNSLSKSGRRINKKLPFITIKFLQLSPNVKIHFKNKSIHLHHWLTYTVILIVTFTFNTGIFESLLSRGYLVGGILQGLSFPDWKKIIAQKN
jgi:hypothetical protein